MSSIRALLIFLTAALSACTSIEEMRQSDPVRSAAFDAPFKDVAACVTLGVAGKYNVTTSVIEREGRAVLTSMNDINAGFVRNREPVWELTVVDEGTPNRSRAEIRTIKTLIGTTPWADDVWPVVEMCAKTVAAHLAPSQR